MSINWLLKKEVLISKYYFSLLFVVATLPALAAGRVECGSVNSKFVPAPVGYCALLPPSYDAQPTRKFPVLYFLHGLGGDQSFLVTSGGWNMLEDAQEQKRLTEFVLITPQADNSFYINSKNGRTKYEDFFMRDFIPQMEKHFRLLDTRAGRAIGGVSMGGYGALRFAFKYPQMFVAVAVHMPALLEELPRGAGRAGLTPYLGTAFGRPLDEAYWKANTPFVYARTANLHGLKIYFDCGDQDNFGFDAGTRELDKLLTARHVPHTAHIYPGAHDWQFVAQHFEESLKVVSDAFTKSGTK
jgi:S-formylglutathione hydrolase FrmB